MWHGEREKERGGVTPYRIAVEMQHIYDQYKIPVDYQ
jgi:hypothetical protein